MTFLESTEFILAHTGTALAMALIFGAGAVFSLPVLRWQVGPLLFFPRWFAGRIERILTGAPSRIRLALFIFSFNSSAILLYMLTGLVYGVPALVAFLTGLNVALAALLSDARTLSGKTMRPLSRSARACAALTFCLELPCFWYAMAMGWAMETRILDIWRDAAALQSARDRVIAYVIVIVPILAISALAEAHAVLSSFGE